MRRKIFRRWPPLSAESVRVEPLNPALETWLGGGPAKSRPSMTRSDPKRLDGRIDVGSNEDAGCVNQLLLLSRFGMLACFWLAPDLSHHALKCRFHFFDRLLDRALKSKMHTTIHRPLPEFDEVVLSQHHDRPPWFEDSSIAVTKILHLTVIPCLVVFCGPLKDYLPRSDTCPHRDATFSPLTSIRH